MGCLLSTSIPDKATTQKQVSNNGGLIAPIQLFIPLNPSKQILPEESALTNFELQKEFKFLESQTNLKISNKSIEDKSLINKAFCTKFVKNNFEEDSISLSDTNSEMR